MKRYRYDILTGSTTGVTYQLPIFLDANLDEMGIMVGFDGDIEQVEQFCNFTYAGSGNNITIYNTVNTNKLKTLTNSVFTISWGDATPDTLLPMATVYDGNLPYTSHTYTLAGTYEIEITVDSPWKVQKLKREIIIPFLSPSLPTDLGTLWFTIPYYNPPTIQSQDYLQDYHTLTGNTNDTCISFLAVGKSRLDEFRLYGSSIVYSGITTGSTEAGNYTGYTIDGLYYMDYADGYTHITGCTSGFTHEELYNGMITRDEHLIGFLDPPQIYSDIFIERGKQGVMERNLRLGEIDNIGELGIYGSGFFKVKKQ